jgi:glycosyltransferase involved in cell wall biosynthesis
MSVEVAVVIPTHNRSERLAGLLRAIEQQTLKADQFEVIVVDDCSTDSAADELKRLGAETVLHLRFLQTPRNMGPAAARNLGWRAADAPYIAFLDDDCTPSRTWLESGLNALASDSRLGVVQGATVAPSPFSPGDFGDHFVWRVIDGPTPYFEACNIFYRKQALEETGGFDEDIAWWGEDVAAGWNVVEAGWRRGFAAAAIAEHPVERRGWRWHIDAGLLDTNFIRLARRYPGFRTEAFWRPWAYRKEDAAFVLGLLGLLVGVRWRPGLAAVLPYCWLRRPSIRHRGFVRLCLQIPVIDVARLAGRIRGSARYKVVVV